MIVTNANYFTFLSILEIDLYLLKYSVVNTPLDLY